MSHYLYKIVSRMPAPAAGNDMGSWFHYYKWDHEDETFVPITGPARAEFIEVSPGDLFWISFDGKLLGCAPIVRVVEEAAQGKVEIWYDAAKKRLSTTPLAVDLETGYVPEEEGDQWAAHLHPIDS